MIAETVLTVGTLVALSMGFPLSLIAARGYQGAPFARVVRPLPVVFGGYIVVNVNLLIEPDAVNLINLVFSTAAIVAALVAAANYAWLLAERREV